MNYNFKKMEEVNKAYLDTLDLEKYISQSTDVRTIINMIEDDYNGSNILPDYLDGLIFNWLTTEDIAYYLAKRYGFCVHEHTAYELCK